jgi:hypothetical protein
MTALCCGLLYLTLVAPVLCLLVVVCWPSTLVFLVTRKLVSSGRRLLARVRS